jgi:hypothetical protein
MVSFSGVILISVTVSLKFKKRIIRVITGAGRYDSCHELFRKLEILPLQSPYIVSLLVFVIKNKVILQPPLASMI